jgi:hypothetical protein
VSWTVFELSWWYLFPATGLERCDRLIHRAFPVPDGASVVLMAGWRFFGSLGAILLEFSSCESVALWAISQNLISPLAVPKISNSADGARPAEHSSRTTEATISGHGRRQDRVDATARPASSVPSSVALCATQTFRPIAFEARRGHIVMGSSSGAVWAWDWKKRRLLGGYRRHRLQTSVR